MKTEEEGRGAHLAQADSASWLSGLSLPKRIKFSCNISHRESLSTDQQTNKQVNI